MVQYIVHTLSKVESHWESSGPRLACRDVVVFKLFVLSYAVTFLGKVGLDIFMILPLFW